MCCCRENQKASSGIQKLWNFVFFLYQCRQVIFLGWFSFAQSIYICILVGCLSISLLSFFCVWYVQHSVQFGCHDICLSPRALAPTIFKCIHVIFLALADAHTIFTLCQYLVSYGVKVYQQRISTPRFVSHRWNSVACSSNMNTACVSLSMMFYPLELMPSICTNPFREFRFSFFLYLILCFSLSLCVGNWMAIKW